MSIIFLLWLHVIKPMIQTANEVDSELQLIDINISQKDRNYQLFEISEKERILSEDFIY